MSVDDWSDLDDLRDRALAVIGTDAAVALMEEAVRRADARHDIESGFALRLDLMVFAGAAERYDRVIVAYAWCLAQHDRHPGCPAFDVERMLRQGRGAIWALPIFPHIRRDQFETLAADLIDRLRRRGQGTRGLYRNRCLAGIPFQDREAARAAFPAWLETPLDPSVDCAVCDRESQVSYWEFLGEDERVIATAEPILSGRVRCSHALDTTYGEVMMPLARLGRFEEAAAAHRKGLKMSAGSAERLWTVGQHIEFLVQTDNRERAFGLLKRHLPLAVEVSSPLTRMEFFWFALFLVERQRKVVPAGTRKLALPPSVSIYRPDGRYSLVELGAWLRGEFAALGDAFDRRNGNTGYRDRLATLGSRVESVTPYPIAAR